MAESLGKLLKGQSIDAALSTVISVGRAAVHAVLPDDFEYYLCSLELVDSDDNRKGFLSFSVMPEQISESLSPIQTMIKTHNGVVTLFNDSFAPRDINIAGTFGRKIRLLLNYKDPLKEQNSYGAGGGFLNLNFGSIAGVEVGIKTGYGMTKVLQHILDSSIHADKDTGKPLYLKFCNYALNTAYVVDLVNYNINQSVGSNMIWNYQISLRAVAPLLAFTKTKNKLKELLPEVAANSIANGVTNIASSMIGL